MLPDSHFWNFVADRTFSTIEVGGLLKKGDLFRRDMFFRNGRFSLALVAKLVGSCFGFL